MYHLIYWIAPAWKGGETVLSWCLFLSELLQWGLPGVCEPSSAQGTSRILFQTSECKSNRPAVLPPKELLIMLAEDRADASPQGALCQCCRLEGWCWYPPGDQTVRLKQKKWAYFGIAVSGHGELPHSIQRLPIVLLLGAQQKDRCCRDWKVLFLSRLPPELAQTTSVTSLWSPYGYSGNSE